MAVIAMFPSEDWDWLRNIQKKLRRGATPIREKRLAHVDELFQLV
jgi:hypothetical protein